MNNLIIKNVEKQTIRRAKAEVARLRMLAEREPNNRIRNLILVQLRKARFWHDVAESAIIDRSAIVRYENNEKLRKKVKLAIATIVAAVLLAILFFTNGCISNTVDGFRKDVNRWTATPEHHQKGENP